MCLRAAATPGWRRSLRRAPLARDRGGRARTPSGCRCRPGSARRSAACSRPGRCAGTRRPDGRSLRRPAPERPASSGGTAPACRRCPAGSAPRRTPVSRSCGHAALRTSVMVEKRLSMRGEVALGFPRIAPRPVDADAPSARVRARRRGSGCRCVRRAVCSWWFLGYQSSAAR